MKRDFELAAQDYDEAMQDYEVARADALSCRAELAPARDAVKNIEAEVTVNGGHEAIVIDGKNAEIRGGQLLLALAAHKGYQETNARVRRLETRLADCEATADSAANRMSLARRRMDFAIAWITQDAALRRNGAELAAIK